MQIIRNPSEIKWPLLSKRPVLNRDKLFGQVRSILKMVKEQGDPALRKLTFRFDRARINDLKVSRQEIVAAVAEVHPELKKAITVAAANIRKFHAGQTFGYGGDRQRKITTVPGVKCWRRQLPIEKVGLYIPGGRAPLFSTVLMLGIPALLAGCREIIVCSPPDWQGKVNPVILYACQYLGLKNIYKVGGAQAVAAMAYGTASIPAVYKIFGPGNQYVTLAKQLVQLTGVGIDMPAGPSEVLVLADETADPEFIAADLLAQAEHGTDSQVILVTTQASLLNRVQKALRRQLQILPRKEIARQSLRHGKLIFIADLQRALQYINLYAPEHLILNLGNPARVLPAIKNAGSVFIGPDSPEAAGDYASGTNHTLPTGGYARHESGISVESFLKMITFQHLSRQGLQRLGPCIRTMADAENLSGHSNSVRVRLEKENGNRR
jgi:histidinol dehydrogenase